MTDQPTYGRMDGCTDGQIRDARTYLKPFDLFVERLLFVSYETEGRTYGCMDVHSFGPKNGCTYGGMDIWRKGQTNVVS